MGVLKMEKLLRNMVGHGWMKANRDHSRYHLILRTYIAANTVCMLIKDFSKMSLFL